MMQLDKTIREGLARQAAAPGTVHPDPDLLTAFVERALSQPERQQVLQHLSRCGDCREAIALSLPEIDVAAVAAAQPETSLWKRWLVVRWAAAAAAVVVVAATVTLYRTTSQPHQVASIIDGPAYVASRQAKAAPQTEAANPGLPRTEAKTEATTAVSAVEPKRNAEPVMVASAAPQQPTAGVAKEKSAATDSLKRQQVAMADKAVFPAPVPPPSVDALSQPTLKTDAKVVPLERPVQVPGMMTAAAGATNEGFPAGNGRALRPSDEPALQTYNQPDGVFTVAEAQPRRNIMFGGRGTEAAKAMQRRESLGSMFSTNPPMPNAPSLRRRWIVTSDGQLEGTHAIGDEWHVVHVADGVFFKSVAESGSEVWVGGIGGALYHSTDDGKSWMKLMPSAGDEPLIADVVGIRATRRGAAELTTSSGERWITVDGGQHWTRQQ